MKKKSWSWRSSGPTPGLSECQGLLTRELGNLDQIAPKESFLDNIPVVHAEGTSTHPIMGNPWPSHHDAPFPALLSFLLSYWWDWEWGEHIILLKQLLTAAFSPDCEGVVRQSSLTEKKWLTALIRTSEILTSNICLLQPSNRINWSRAGSGWILKTSIW